MHSKVICYNSVFRDLSSPDRHRNNVCDNEAFISSSPVFPPHLMLRDLLLCVRALPHGHTECVLTGSETTVGILLSISTEEDMLIPRDGSSKRAFIMTH